MRNFVLCLVLFPAVLATGAQIQFSFGTDSASQSLTNFQSVLAGTGRPGNWKIVQDAVPSAFAPLTAQAPVTSRQGVLAQTSQDPSENRFPLFIYNGETFQDFKLNTRFKMVSGLAEQMAGIVFHYQNPSNFYVFRASALGHNVRFYKVVNGEFLDPKTVPLDVAPNAWHTLDLQCEGNMINCGLDGKLVMPLQTPMTFTAGQIGFWTMADSVTYFGDTTIDYKPRIPAAQELVKSIIAKEPRIITLRIYLPDGQGRLRVVASKDPQEIGMAGEDAEKNALADGTVSFGKSSGISAVTLPLRDRNGDPIAAVRVRLHSFLGETQENAVTRATQIIKLMQAQISSADQLLQ